MIDRFTGEHIFLSNFYRCEVRFHGITFPTSEHAYQGCKTDDFEKKEEIAAAPTPSRAKELGRKLDLPDCWNHLRVVWMWRVLCAKFGQNDDIRARLLNTGNQTLVEGNDWGDTFWGVCDGDGKNLLGRLLMRLRDTIWRRKQEKFREPYSRERLYGPDTEAFTFHDT